MATNRRQETRGKLLKVTNQRSMPMAIAKLWSGRSLGRRSNLTLRPAIAQVAVVRWSLHVVKSGTCHGHEPLQPAEADDQAAGACGSVGTVSSSARGEMR